MYLSGRQRAGKEMNGKSANLNNCLRQLYPGDHPVPATEVVCIFDADQARPRWNTLNPKPSRHLTTSNSLGQASLLLVPHDNPLEPKLNRLEL